MKFVHLHTHSHYSLLDGMSKIPDLITRAKELKMKSIALTDHGNLYGAVEFYREAKKAGIKPILGVEAYIAPGDCREKSGNKDQRGYYHLILLAKNETGWKNLLQLVTASYLEGYYYKPRMDKEMLKKHSEGLIALSGCLGGEIPQLLLREQNAEVEKVAKEYSEIFKDNYYIEIGKHPEIKDAEIVLPKLIALAKKLDLPLVATKDSHYLYKEDRPAHDILLSIQTGQTMEDEKRFKLDGYYHLAGDEEMSETFKNNPEAIENTAKIAQQCNVELSLDRFLLPKFKTPKGESAKDYLKKLVMDKIKDRYPNKKAEVLERINYELGIITEMGFPDYFLIVSDFVNWAKERGIIVGPGRGSATGSIVSYILGITNLDPIHYGLVFERFLNPHRISMPDIDLDIADTRRDEVYGYIEGRYGKDRVAHIITFGTMAARAAIRDVGRAMAIEYSFCDYLAKLVPFQKNLSQALKIVPELSDLYKNDERATRIIDSAKKLEGVARHASIHACGILISADPLVNHVPLQFSPQKDDVVVTQFEMHSAEALGLLKIDLLGLKNLSIIEETIGLVEEESGEKIDIDKIPLDDKKTFAMLQKAETTGVFQLESGGMRRYLKELVPTELEDIIAMGALYRPGPMDLIPSYIARKHGKEQVTYLHPKLKPILESTYGIGVYQEQMLRIAADIGGFTLAQADVLRKAIGKKIKKLLDEQKEKLVKGMMKNGIDNNTANAIWELFLPFARYGFNRSHAAAYAMIAYQTAWLKANYKVSFFTALLNSDSGDTERMSFLMDEAKKINIETLPPDINKSSSRFTPDLSVKNHPKIRFGLAAIKNVGGAIVDAIIEERNRGGDFKSFPDLISRIIHKDLNKKSIESLAKAGAFDSLGISRNTILSNIETVIKFSSNIKKNVNSNQGGLFGDSFIASATSLDLEEAQPLETGQKLAWEKELLGLYVSDHPLKAHKKIIDKINPTDIAEIKKDRSDNKGYRVVGLVTRVKSIITKKNQQMAFVRLEDLSDGIEVVVFSDLYEQTKKIWEDGNLIALVGKLSFRNGEISIIADQAKKIA